MSGWLYLIPELIMASIAIIIVIADLMIKREQRSLLTITALLGVIITLVAVWLCPEGAFGKAFALDGVAKLFKTIILVALLFVLLLINDFEKTWKRPQGELLLLILSSATGMMMLVSGQELILIVVALECATFPLVLLTAYQPQLKTSAEGGLKYLFMAALGTAILLFGLSLVVAVTGVTTLSGIAAEIAAAPRHPLFLAGIVFLIGGVGFKIALVPFHMWAPDTYEGAPTPVTAFLSVAGKTAGFALAVRLFTSAFPAMHQTWITLFAILAAGSMLLGNFAAIPQTNAKRLLAYSSIAQAGYMLMGLVAFGKDGLASLIYYLIAYLFTNMAAFAVVIAVERGSGRTDINAYKGLAQRSPKLALIMMLALLSLAGIPPLAGFTAKFYLFTAVFGQGFAWLVLLAVLNSALSLYYYLKVIRLMYIESPEDSPAGLISPHWALTAALLLTTAGVLIIGIIPRPFVTAAREAVAKLL